jgi:hypothetical protein
MARWTTFIVVVVLTACGGPSRYQLTGGREAPAASGEVKASTSENQNTRLVITVQHLAAPDRLTPGATSYVVWVAPHGKEAEAQNIGALQVNDKLEGKLETVTPLQQFALWITAEPSPRAQSPTGTRVMSTHVRMN